MCYNKNMKTFLITGASGGIGSAIAKILAKKNNKLILIYNNSAEEINNLKNELSTICEVDVYKCNLTNEEEIQTLVADIVKHHQKIDCLINCAGVSLFEQIQDTTSSSFDYVLNNNLKSTVLLTSKVSKHMISEQSGRIINISSMWGVVGSSMESLYSASKGAINALTLSLAKELGPSNITVNAICPGLINTKMNKNLSTETINSIVEETPLNRIGTPEDVANLVEFLSSDKASFITGQIITVDGGFTL